MDDAEILEVVRTSTTWSEVDDRLAEWHACKAWWSSMNRPGGYLLSRINHTPPRERLSMFRKYGPGGRFVL